MTDAEVAQAYRDHAGAVYARGARILRDREAARDVTQEVFVRCFGRGPDLRSQRELLAWLYRVTTNLCLNAIRNRKLRGRADRDAAHFAPAAAAPEGPARRGLWDLLAGLDDRTQAIVIYVHLDGMTQAEAAEVAGVSDRTVRNCLARFEARARARLGVEAEPILAKELS
ncbi:MAG TPA: RNA polymerase sigma factor [Polyangia bacterium]|nr:RNA polymerase sigma factor [Polyangia bacterium]